jgi:hypothetical protein
MLDNPSRTRVRTADVYVSLGYSPVYTNGGSWMKEQIKGLVDVLGDFGTIRFHVHRLSEQCFKVNIYRRHALVGEERLDVNETLTGLVNDQMILRNGESLTVAGFFQDRCMVKLYFWANY